MQYKYFYIDLNHIIHPPNYTSQELHEYIQLVDYYNTVWYKNGTFVLFLVTKDRLNYTKFLPPSEFGNKTWRFKNGYTVMMTAAKYGILEQLPKQLCHKITAKNNEGNNICMIAAINGTLDKVPKEFYTDAYVKNNNGCTVAMLYVMYFRVNEELKGIKFHIPNHFYHVPGMRDNAGNTIQSLAKKYNCLNLLPSELKRN